MVAGATLAIFYCRGRTRLLSPARSRQHLSAGLSSLGYRTIDADSGAAALEPLDSHAVDLVLSGVLMPGGMNGL